MRIKHTLTVEQELIKEIKLIAVKEDLTYGQLIEKALREYLLKHKE